MPRMGRQSGSWLTRAAELFSVGAIVVGVVMYVREGPSRERSAVFQAWGVVAQAEKKEASLGRPQAIRQLKEQEESLVGIVLEKARLKNVDFGNSDLTDGNLGGLYCTNCLFEAATLSKVNVEDATFRSPCRFSGATLERVDGSGAKFLDCAIDKAALTLFKAEPRRASFNGSTFIDSTISRSTLRDAIFDNADLRNARFIDTDLRRANFQRANVAGMKWITVDAEFAELNHIHGEKAEFSGGSRMVSARFDSGVIHGALFRDIDLRGASFLGAELADAVFENCDISNANFTSADLQDAKFINCVIEGAIFRQTKNWDYDRSFKDCRGAPAVVP